MTKKELKPNVSKVKEMLIDEKDFLKVLIQEALNECLEAEMKESLNAARYERTEQREAYRSGYYQRSLNTRVGKIELRVPQDRSGVFSTQLFSLYQRSEQALVMTMIEAYVQGVSTRKLKSVTEELCGHRFSPSTISDMVKRLDDKLKAFSDRALECEYPYLILDARYERVREDGVIRDKAVLIAIGISWEGRREVLAVELAGKESHCSWKALLCSLEVRGLRGVEFVVSDDHKGLRHAIREVLPRAIWQRCYVHFLRNALEYLPRKADDDCLMELRWLYDRRTIAEARMDLCAWLKKWQERYPKLCNWVEETIEETFSYFQLPLSHHKHMKSTNMLERLNQEIKRRTHLVRIFPNEHSCLRLVRALAVEIHENWIESIRYLNMQLLKELKKMKLIEGGSAA
jgi:putative transposase